MPKILAHLSASVEVIDGDVGYALRVVAVAVIYYERDAHVVAKVGVVLVAKAYDDNPVHVPHRSKLDDIICRFGFLDHHEETVSLNFIREVIER